MIMQIDLAAVKQISIDMMLKSARIEEKNSDFLVFAGRFIVKKLKETQLPMNEFKPLIESAYATLARRSHGFKTIQEYFKELENQFGYTMKSMENHLKGFDETINIVLDENLENLGITDEWLYGYSSKVQGLTDVTWSCYQYGFFLETVNEEGQVTKQRCYGVSLNKEHLFNCNMLKQLNNLQPETFEKNMRRELRNIVCNVKSAIEHDHPTTPDKLLHGLFAAHCFSTKWSETMCDNTSVFQSDVKKIFEDVLTESVYAEAYRVVGRPVLKALNTVKASASLPENVFEEMMSTEKDWIDTTKQQFDQKNARSHGLNEFLTQLKSVQKEVEQRIRVFGQTHPLGQMEGNSIDLSNKQIEEIINAVEIISALQNKNGFITAQMESSTLAEELKNRAKIAQKVKDEKEWLLKSVERERNMTEELLKMRGIREKKYSIPDNKEEKVISKAFNSKFGKRQFRL